MVILIAGGSHTGKTLLAQRLLERYRMPYLSIDHLKMGLIRSGQTALTPEDDGELTGYLWPIVREMVKTAVENGQSLAVEGVYIPHDWREGFGAEYLEHIRYVCLVMSGDYIRSHREDILGHGSDIEKRLWDEVDWDGMTEENEENLRQCRERGESCVLIDGDYSARLAEWLESIGTELT